MIPRRQFLKTVAASAAITSPLLCAETKEQPARVLIIVGPTDHPPGTHEVAAGGRLMKHALENAANVPGVKADVFYEWPKDDMVRAAAATVVFIGDTFPLQRLPDSKATLAQLGAMMARGCGIVCVHYATGLRAEDVAADGAHPLLGWLGGYFATKCVHHQSLARIFPEATITPAAAEHPVCRGWKEFTLYDEPYINNYFGPDGNKLAANVTALATAQLPPEAPQREVVAWGVERADGGRGFGIVMPHFYKNWQLADLRRCILNGIVWTAHRDVPPAGVETAPPELSAFAPVSIEPQPWKPKVAAAFAVEETAERITLRGAALEASIKKRGYVSGVEAGSFLDKQTGARDLGFGLDIQDWIMEPGSDAADRSQLPGDLPYDFGNAYHGKTPKRNIEGPQICTQAKELHPRVIEGKDFVAIEQSWKYTLAAPGRQTGSEWKQTLVFPAGKRYFLSSDRILSRNSGDALFFRQDMPGHVQHKGGDTFSEVYLSYRGKIPASEFAADFAPDEKFNYRRDRDGRPARMIRAYHTRDPKTGADGPWLAGMTLNSGDTSEAWCHQRTGYVCFIHEVGERPVKAGESFGAAYIVGWFDSIEEMAAVYDQYRGHSALEVTAEGWQLRP